MDGSFTTTVIWHDSRGSECEAEVRVTYVGRHGFPETRTDPAEPATVEITDIVPINDDAWAYIPDDLFERDDLIAECFEDWDATCEAAEEARAEDYRDRMREEADNG
ncbi:hypothetical protein CVO77_00385 [Sphingopyxis lindanitolerans]|uniref:Uncharacterized protein n=1 Tax=Sphingopyxis lindanitolerans TaxID=2054227 RepID=A0A2S8BAT2_9SPHN|nr:hypothetical protein [Sphingopyxis lindanitolerans]PQM29430.1 hypothetical protein CVO77_00385 [Sphingopyxis lindanitolerans]